MAHPNARNESRAASPAGDPVGEDRRRHRRHNVALITRIGESNQLDDVGVCMSTQAVDESGRIPGRVAHPVSQ